MSAIIRTFVFISLTTIIIAFFVQPAAGYAQEPSVTETPVTEITETPISTANVEITETATSVQNEAEIQPTENEEMSRLLIKISRNARLANVMIRMNEYGQVVENEELGKLGIFILEVPTEQLDEKISVLRNVSGVGWVEPDYPVQALETIPNDPSFVSQYALTAIHAPQGWDISTGSSAVTIAILDSGVDLNHPDLAGKIVQGYDFVNIDANPQDDYGHGTHVAGIAAALSNNSLGITGTSWGAKIMPVKVLNSTGGGSFKDVASGVVWATDHGAQIINMSLGGFSFSQTAEDAIAYAVSHGVLLVAASGNSNANFVLYPARSSYVMAVAATDANNQRATFSNYGTEIEIAAPGNGILSLWPGGGYNTLSGTSMATPYVSGLAAILIGYESNATLVRTYLKESALDIAPAGFDIFTGAGLIQMDAALKLVVSAPTMDASTAQGPAADFPLPFSSPIQLRTQTPLATFTTAPVTLTFTLQPTVTTFPLPSTTTLVMMETATLESDSHEQYKQLDSNSPFLYCGIALLISGIVLLCLTKQNRYRKSRW